MQLWQDPATAAITTQTPVEELVKMFTNGVPKLRERDNWWLLQNVQLAHQEMARTAVENLPSYPGKYEGKGIVICAGGHRLFTNGWVCMRILRMLGCTLPIQFWHLENEIDQTMRDIVKPYGVECIDASKLEKPRILAGWELKAFAIQQCPFKEVLLLDADNVAVVNPTFLFDCKAYRDTGALFWPDYGKLAQTRPIWWIFETKFEKYPHQHEFESGQIVVNKEIHWKPMCLTMWMNEHSDFYYRYIHGDKCTFEMAWKRLEAPFHLIQKPIQSLESAVMCQHSPVDFSRLFQHRNMDKWQYSGNNRIIRDFIHEDKCREFLADLRQKWSGQPFVERTAVNLLANYAGRYAYRRIGHDERMIELLPDGTVGKGSARCEMFWSVKMENNEPVLTITGTNPIRPTCQLTYRDNKWVGRWIHYEKMPIELVKINETRSQ